MSNMPLIIFIVYEFFPLVYEVRTPATKIIYTLFCFILISQQ